jgi:hypothetical protein
LSSSKYDFLTCGFKHIRIPIEDENTLSQENYHTSILYNTLVELNPDILLFDLVWYSTYCFIHELPCKKIFLVHQVHDRFFSINLPETELVFKPEHYDLVLGIEPFKSCLEMDYINPIIFRNKDEVMTKEEALKKLNINPGQEVCYFSINNKAPNFQRIRKKYSYLDDAYCMVYSYNYEHGLFPEIDYYNAFDFIVCGGGYNQFWSVIYFDKEAAVEPIPLIFEDHNIRIKNGQDYTFSNNGENGADQLVDIMMSL